MASILLTDSRDQFPYDEVEGIFLVEYFRGTRWYTKVFVLASQDRIIEITQSVANSMGTTARFRMIECFDRFGWQRIKPN